MQIIIRISFDMDVFIVEDTTHYWIKDREQDNKENQFIFIRYVAALIGSSSIVRM